MEKRQVNSVDIAKIAGVSRGTVSKVLNNYPGISETTRNKVLEAVEKSGYYPNFYGQALTGKNRRVLCYFRFDTGAAEPHAAYTTSLIALGIYNVASRLGYQVLSVLLKPDGSDLDQVEEVFQQGRVDGGITESHVLLQGLIDRLSTQWPLGVIDHPSQAAEGGGICVDMDNYRCGVAAIDYLVKELGHRKIAVINGSRDWSSQTQRLRGFEDGLQKHGLSIVNPLRDCSGFYERNGYRRMLEILDGPERPTAIACTNDNLAMGAIQAILERGMRVPEDFSVVGMENNPVGAYFDPPLTTFRLDIESAISDLVTAVVNKLEDSQAICQPGDYPARLVKRNSCCAPRDNPNGS